MKVRVVSGFPEGSHRGRSCGWPWITAVWGRIGTWPNGSWRGKPPKPSHCGTDAASVEVDETLARKWSGYPPVK